MSQDSPSHSLNDEAPLLLGTQFATDLQLDKPAEPPVLLSTRSPAALKLGTRQLIPKSLAVSSRPRPRHYTTVVTLPVEREVRVAPPLEPEPDLDYDSDGDGCSIRRNRRNMSYRAAVTTPPSRATTLKPVSEEGPSPNKRTLRRRTRQRKGGSFKDEPRLYQQIRERGLHSNNQHTDDELLEDAPPEGPPNRDKTIVVKNYRPTQVTWSQLPQVQEMGILQTITPEERKRQEAIFELITSEYSYQHSLAILVQHFQGSAELRRTMTTTEHHHLFSNIAVILSVSQRFFEDLESRHLENPVIGDIGDIVRNHALQYFQPYITYCSNETFQQRTLQKLLATNTAFKEALKRIEGSAECGGLPIISFLILPMQRVTRLPLLLDTICQKTPENSPFYASVLSALKAISKLVKLCNDGARTMERTEQMYTIQKQMEFGKIKPFPLVSASRWLLKRGELVLCAEELSIFSKAFGHRSYHLFLFNDVLIVTRKKSEDCYLVMDYATLGNVEVEFEPSDKPSLQSPKDGAPALFTLKLLLRRNSEGRAEQMTLTADTQLERARWVTALRKHKEAEQKNKEGLPQCEVTKAFMPKEPDELGLQQAEVVLILQKEEGWYYGERLRDGARGWFPSSCATEITNRAAVEHNVRRMQRLRETNV